MPDVAGVRRTLGISSETRLHDARPGGAAAAKISEAVARQREGTAQVRTAIVDIVGAVNDSLSGSAETTRNAESLLQLSHELKVAAKNFRVGGQDSPDIADESPR